MIDSGKRVRMGILVAGSLIPVWLFGQSGSETCPEGWKEKVPAFLSAQLDRDAVAAALLVSPSERKDWEEWKIWSWQRDRERLAGMAPPVQERAAAELARDRARLEVSQYTCDPIGGEQGRYRVRVDPDGRSYQFVELVLEQGTWWIHTGMHAMSAEQRRVVTAYLSAVDDGRWEEAEAWVARSALTRFKGYRAEVEVYMAGSEVMAEAVRTAAAQRRAEWDSMFLWADRVEEGVVVVHAEFPTAQSLAVEMTEVDGAWRILHR